MDWGGSPQASLGVPHKPGITYVYLVANVGYIYILRTIYSYHNISYEMTLAW